MSSDPTAHPADPGAGPGAGAGAGQPSEEELRAAYEAELSRITSADLMLQAAVSLLNVGSYRLAPRAVTGAAAAAGDDGSATSQDAGPAPSDLEQARDAIDGARALLEILERSAPTEIAPLRNALSQLQIAYARAVQAAGGAPVQGGATPEGGGTPPAGGSTGGGEGGAPAGDDQAGGGRPPGPGPAESSGRLWVPGR
ncbi:MAG TPA: hypothetical protein VGH09_11565 [Solirubrobacteraceae bacterium]|jgi:hypothetical protein